MHKYSDKEDFKKEDFFEKAEKVMSKDSIERARLNGQEKAFRYKLAELRKNLGKTQSDITAFKQASVSKIEGRGDIKLSTLVDYLESLGLGIEIRTYPHNNDNTDKYTTLLKT